MNKLLSILALLFFAIAQDDLIQNEPVVLEPTIKVKFDNILELKKGGEVIFYGLIIGKVEKIISTRGSIATLKINKNYSDILNEKLSFSVEESLVSGCYVEVERCRGLDKFKKITYGEPDWRGIVESIDIFEWSGDPMWIPTIDEKIIIVESNAKWKVLDLEKFHMTLSNEYYAQSKLDNIFGGVIGDYLSMESIEKDIDINSIEEKIFISAQNKLKTMDLGFSLVDFQISSIFDKTNYKYIDINKENE